MGPRSLGLSIRPARDEDCEVLSAIYQESLDAKDSCMELESTPQKFRDMMEHFHQREVLLVVEDDGVVRGWGTVKRYSDRPGYRVACETSIYFSRSCTGRGYGGRLQKELIERARCFGYHHIVTKIWTSNLGSLRFHERFGFKTVGVQKEIGYLGGAWRDVTILQLILDDVPPYRPEAG